MFWALGLVLGRQRGHFGLLSLRLARALARASICHDSGQERRGGRTGQST
jgi:hypothetical protein